MRTSRLFAFALVSGMFSWGLTAAPAKAAPGYEIYVAGDATPYAYGGIADGTTVQIPVIVRCPAGTSAYVPFAGLPGYFTDGRFAEPYLPAHTGPATYGGQISCTGSFQTASTIARSVGRNQDPSTHPYQYFTPGPATAKVILIAAETVAEASAAIEVLPSPATEIVIHTSEAILQSPMWKPRIEVVMGYRCAAEYDGQRGYIYPVVSHAAPLFDLTCSGSWQSASYSAVSAHVGEIVVRAELPGRHVARIIKVTPALPDAVGFMTLSHATAYTMQVAWSAPPPREGALGPVPDTSITGYKVGWIEASTGRGWETESPHWPLSYSPVTLTGLLPNTLYTVWVIPVNASGDGPATTRSYSTTPDVVGPPPAPPSTPPVVGPPPAIVAPPLAPPAQPIFATTPVTPPVVVLPQVTTPVTPPVVVLPQVTTPPPAPVLTNVAVLPSLISRIPSRITIVATQRVRRGGAAGFSGMLTTLRGGKYVRASGLRVVLQRLDGRKWVNVAPATSKGARAGRLHGSVNLNLRPSKTTTYRWVFAGTSTVAPAISKPITVTVIR